MIRLDKVSRRFGRHLAVDALEFGLERGELTAFLGPNGAGKTTTMRLITGVLAPSSGQVLLAGEDVHRARPELRNRIGYLPENCPLYEDMTPLELLETVARLRGLDRSRRLAAIGRVVTRCGLREMATRPIGKLSKGFRQRVGLAQALLHDPEVLILDEPTTGLDPNQIRDIQALVTELGETRTVLLSTHLLHQVPEICDRVLVLAEGRLVFQGTPAELRARGKVNTVSLRTSLDEQALRTALEHCPFVRSISEASGDVTLEGDFVEARLAEVASAIHRAGGRLTRLVPQEPSLETVFARLTEPKR